MPADLAARARVILAGQRDVEYQLRARMGAVAAALAAARHPGAPPTPVYLDRRS